MTVAAAIHQASARLSGLSARLDAEVLMRHVLGLSRIELYRRLFDVLTPGDEALYSVLIDRLIAGEPLQYLTGHTEFYALEFYVNPTVLIPRPETEILVAQALDIARLKTGDKHNALVIADVGCGSGAVAVTLAKHLPESVIFAIDTSPEALNLARRNAASHAVTNIEFIHGDLLDGVADRRLDIVCANLPYVPSAEARGNRFEPQLALDGGPDGLDIIRRLVSQTAARDDKPGWLLLEFGSCQSAAVKSIINQAFPGNRTEIIRDLIPLDRVSVTKLPP
ncbi:peptide chain release factor N(5)-glutamine methyltransferase [Dehalogenimonas alkenigignens]|uniref:Release factor glutamine methyltransferase n=1 Tax=Dehalogenimonas alkenigignens TaxID=1217799 RepID=A0A0W0GJU1_9CHLR|nr:peptide chain release factor N(5)-glutamine methyltransferase [Dehalogenimonas alkenigignens]KTB48841.1 protein-(glutamine-N5) methyltransferase, release factor-specific [Dehalogenimonas alkenigignens]PVV84752.1 peptide chain release factor N(5)-glutamine methyltransferase [Dehalogenimonas alkenigignens]